MVLDRVVSPSGEHLGHLCPFVSVGSVGEKENPLLMWHPFDLEDVRVEVIMPSLPALLPQPALHEFRNEGPSLRPVLFY